MVELAVRVATPVPSTKLDILMALGQDSRDRLTCAIVCPATDHAYAGDIFHVVI